MKLTDHFTLEEMTVSQEAARRGLSNKPSPGQIKNLTELCANVLEPLRQAAGKPVVVSSGFRSATVNQAVGGAKTSDHLEGRAADLTIPGLTPLEVCRLIVKLNLPFKQCIHEFAAWCHVSIPASSETPKREQLTITTKGTTKGLV